MVVFFPLTWVWITIIHIEATLEHVFFYNLPSSSIPLMHPAPPNAASHWRASGHIVQGIRKVTFILRPTLQCKMPSLIPSLVAEHQLWLLLPLWSCSQGTKMILSYSFLSKPHSSSPTPQTLSFWTPASQSVQGIRSSWQTQIPFFLCTFSSSALLAHFHSLFQLLVSRNKFYLGLQDLTSVRNLGPYPTMQHIESKLLKYREENRTENPPNKQNHI